MCPKGGFDVMWSSSLNDGRSENDGIFDAAAAAAENVAAVVVVERRDIGGHCHSICCAAGNTGCDPMRSSET